jgi:hypothetical protein
MAPHRRPKAKARTREARTRPARNPGRSRTATLLIVALVVGGFAGAAVERQSIPEPEVATSDTSSAPFDRYDVSAQEAHLGQLAPAVTVYSRDGDRIEIDHRDGRPRVLLLVRPDCDACDDTIAAVAAHLERSGYDPATARYELALVSVSATPDPFERLPRLGWTHPERSFTAEADLLTAVGFDREQLPAWFFTYPDGTLAGREQGTLDYDTYRRITTVLAATLP